MEENSLKIISQMSKRITFTILFSSVFFFFNVSVIYVNVSMYIAKTSDRTLHRVVHNSISFAITL